MPADAPDADLEAVAWGGGEWLALGNARAWTSPDGLSWTGHDRVDDNPQDQSLSLAVRGLVWTGERWVAVGWEYINGDWTAQSVGWVGTSLDGLLWSAVARPEDPLNGLTWNGNRLVAVGDGIAGWSDGGTAWTFDDLGISVALQGVAWSGERFVAVGRVQLQETESADILLSGDGTTWTHTGSGSAAGGELAAVAASPAGLAAVGPGNVDVSSDGTGWEQTLAAPLAENIGPAVAAEPGLVAVGELPGTASGLRSRTAWSSSDGIDWTVVSIPAASSPVTDLAARGAVVVGICPDTNRSVVVRGEDGQWVAASLPGTQHARLSGVASGPNGFVAVAKWGAGAIFESQDGLSWVDRSIPGVRQSWVDAVWTGSRYLAMSTFVKVAVSVDGLSWSIAPVDNHWPGIERLAAGGGTIVGAGMPGRLQLSTDDGASWALADTPPYTHLRDVRWTGMEFLAVGDEGSVLESPNGRDWTSDSPPLKLDLLGCGTIGGRTVVTGAGGTIQVRVKPAPALDDPSPYRLVVPAAVHAPGLAGSFWTTGLFLTNPNGRAALVRLRFLPREGQPVTVPEVIPSGSSVAFDDMVATVFDRPGEAGSVIIDPDEPVVAASRTSSNVTAGSAGQILPGLTMAQTGSGVAVLPGLAGGPGFRTNIGLVNLGDDALDCTVAIHGSDGTVLATRTATIGPWESAQLNRVLHGLDTGAGAWAAVACGGPFATYASVVDFGTNDGATVLPSPVTSGPLLIPAAAHAPGYGGALWRTDLDIVNPGQSAASVALELLTKGGGTVSGGTVEIPVGSAVALRDVLGTRFPGHTAGAIRIVPVSGEVAAWSRTYDVTGEGTLGQGVGALALEHRAGGSGKLIIGGLKGGPSLQGWFHTNLGLVNVSDQPVTVTVKIFAGNGVLLSSLQEDVPAEGWLQVLTVLRTKSVAPVADAYAVIDAGENPAAIVAWASVIDNTSGDPSFLLGRTVPAAPAD